MYGLPNAGQVVELLSYLCRVAVLHQVPDDVHRPEQNLPTRVGVHEPVADVSGSVRSQHLIAIFSYKKNTNS